MLPLLQAFSVFLINSQSFPMFPSHPDPQLSPLILWMDTLMRHPATLLMMQPAVGHITCQPGDTHICNTHSYLSSFLVLQSILVGPIPAMVCSQ